MKGFALFKRDIKFCVTIHMEYSDMTEGLVQAHNFF